MPDHDPNTPAAPPPSPRFLPGLLLLFVGSGCSALVYEIVWFQLLQLVIGSSAVSMGVLLGTFMGGMCLGSLALPRIISPRRHPLRVYALLELGTGILGIAVLLGMPLVDRLYTTNVGHGLPGIFLRGAVCAICLLPPTLLMGATLPAIARWIEATPQGVSWLGFFYGGNIAGAVFGCLLAGFYLLRIHDMATATYVAASINCRGAGGPWVGGCCGVCSAAAARAGDGGREGDKGLGIRDWGLEKRNQTGTSPLESEIPNPQSLIPNPQSWPVYVAIGLSGLCAWAPRSFGPACCR